jgi:hypothetical protein
MIVLGFVFLLSMTALAQEYPKIEIPLGFSFVNVHPDITPITSFNVFGGGGGFVYNFSPVIGIKADFMGYTQGSGLKNKLETLGYAGQVNGNLFTYMFGPQIKKHTGRVQPFGEALFGAAHTNAYASIYDAVHGVTTASSNNNAFAMAFGGGIDIVAGRHFFLRPVEVDYLYTRFGVNGTNYTGNQNNFRYVGGFGFTFGGAPPVPPTASCSASPTEVYAGDTISARVATQNFNPKHDLTYKWGTTGGKIPGTGTTASVDTTGLQPGSYTISSTVTDQHERKNNVASCSAGFTVKARPNYPPTASCSANPNAIAINQSATINITAKSPENRPLTYAWTSTGGQLSGSGTSATLTATNADAGNTITVTGTTTDDHGLSTSCTASVTVPAVQKVQEVEDWGECTFEKNPKKPWRVDNDCKDVLDKLALRVQQMPNGKVAIVGYTDQEEVVNAEQLGAQRAVNIKYYLTTDEIGPKLDPTRLQPYKGGKKGKKARFYFVPQGATFQEEEAVTVDETVVQGQSRSAAAPAKKGKKAASTH